MIVRWGALHRATGLTPDSFADEWLSVHVPLVERGAPGMRHYVQNIVVDAEQRSPFPRGGRDFDGFSQLTFDTLDEMRHSMERLRANEPLDLAHFAESVQVLVTVRKLDRSPPDDRRGLVKRISLLRRRPELSAEDFQREWWTEHSDLVRELPGYVGYAQHLVVDRLVGSGGATYDDLPVDGIVEFWFPSSSAMDECYGSPQFARVAEHGRAFISEITTYLVDEAVTF